MERRKKIMLGMLVGAGAMVAWIAHDDPDPRPIPGTASVVPDANPDRRIPGLPYHLAPEVGATATYQDTARPQGYREDRYQQPRFQAAVPSYQFRPQAPDEQRAGRYQPYQAPPAFEPGYGYGLPGVYAEQELPAVGTVPPPVYPGYRFRPSDDHQRSRRPRGGYRPMTTPPGALASPDEARRLIPHPS